MEDIKILYIVKDNDTSKDPDFFCGLGLAVPVTSDIYIKVPVSHPIAKEIEIKSLRKPKIGDHIYVKRRPDKGNGVWEVVRRINENDFNKSNYGEACEWMAYGGTKGDGKKYLPERDALFTGPGFGLPDGTLDWIDNIKKILPFLAALLALLLLADDDKKR